MVVNHKYKFVFVHVPKTAGTSITKSIRRLRGNSKRWLADGTQHETLKGLYLNLSKRKTLLDKVLARSIDDYFAFAFVRNPWDRMSSLYHYLCRKQSRKEIRTVSSFRDFVYQAADRREWIMGLHSMRPQIDFLMLEEPRLDIDFVGHYEHLDEDISRLSARIGCSVSPGVHNQSSNSSMDYRVNYSSRMVDAVEELFRADCVQFGYQFEKPCPGKRYSGRSAVIDP